MLAESEEQLLPDVVHGQSMRVIDGIHRARAAVMRGEKDIDAKAYHGTDDDAFALAVRMKVAHGPPLTAFDCAKRSVGHEVPARTAECAHRVADDVVKALTVRTSGATSPG
ncbi:MAG: hypothetical protein ACRDKX_09615 [Solirubrobacterales bacterium]